MIFDFDKWMTDDNCFLLIFFFLFSSCCKVWWFTINSNHLLFVPLCFKYINSLLSPTIQIVALICFKFFTYILANLEIAVRSRTVNQTHNVFCACFVDYNSLDCNFSRIVSLATCHCAGCNWLSWCIWMSHNNSNK